MRQRRPSPENETLTKQPKERRNTVDQTQVRGREQLPEAALLDMLERRYGIIDSAMDAVTVVVCGYLADQRHWSLSSLR
jgi:hypothetical protein